MDAIYNEISTKYTKEKIYGFKMEFGSYSSNDGKKDHANFQKFIKPNTNPDNSELRNAAKNLTFAKWLAKRKLDNDFKYIISYHDPGYETELKFVRVFKLNPNNQFTAIRNGNHVQVTAKTPAGFLPFPITNGGE
ncbi:hypothetical protein [uncultured Microscilla sp.]|uniref:hypothetical protein n=1 Tax=uncultured Microscilla sp. TaxID=432653 RepID=UPI0026377457|nr:hypothetical protein [uncultured Microscilla sp.]